MIEGKRYWLGAAGHAPAPALAEDDLGGDEDGSTWIVLADDMRALARIAVAAAPRPEAAQ